MKVKQFAKEIAKIQKFLDLNDWDISYKLVESPWYMGQLSEVDYKRFQAYLTFDSNVLNEPDKTIRILIMHELSHVFTISSLRIFENDGYIREYIWTICHKELIVRMDIINEQMTVRLERILTKHYNA